MSFDNIPLELKKVKQWVCWKVEKGTKVPKIAAGDCSRGASSTDKKTWRSYDQCVDRVLDGRADGIGFVFTEEDDYTAIDLDNKEADTVLDLTHGEIIKDFDSYTEWSPSGTGYHVIIKSDPFKSFNNSPYEAYYSKRYMTFTGVVVDGRDTIKRSDEALRRFIGEFGGEGVGERYQVPDIDDFVVGNRNDELHRMASMLHGRRVDDETIIKLVTLANRGLDKPLPANEVKLLIQSALQRVESDEYNVFDELVERYAFIADQNAYCDIKQGGVLLTRQAIDTVHHCEMPQDQDTGKRIPPSAFLKANEHTAVYTSIGWHPGEGERYTNHTGMDCLNLYKPPTLKPKRGPIKPWLDHITWLIPDKEVRDAVIDWMAYTVQQPGRKANWSVFIAGPERIGKDAIFQPLHAAVGQHNCTEINAAELESDFNEYLHKTKLLTIGEMHTDVRTARKIENKLKQILTNPPTELSINKKGVTRFTIANVVSVIFMSNHRDALNVTGGNGARYLAYWCDVERKPDSYYEKLFNWLDGHAAQVAYYLQHRDLTNFNPKASAIQTEFMGEIVQSSKSGLQQTLEMHIAEADPPFDKDLITLHELLEVMQLKPAQMQQVVTGLKAIGSQGMQAQRKGQPKHRVWPLRRIDMYKAMSPLDLHKAYTAQLGKTRASRMPQPAE